MNDGNFRITAERVKIQIIYIYLEIIYIIYLENNDTKPSTRNRPKLISSEISKDEMKNRWTPVIAGILVIWPTVKNHEKISDSLGSNS